MEACGLQVRVAGWGFLGGIGLNDRCSLRMIEHHVFVKQNPSYRSNAMELDKRNLTSRSMECGVWSMWYDRSPSTHSLGKVKVGTPYIFWDVIVLLWMQQRNDE